MAKKKSAAQPHSGLKFGLKVDLSDDSAAYYANHAEISGTAHDYQIAWARIPAKPNASQVEEAEQTGFITVQPVVQIIFPASMIDGLIQALQRQKQTFEETERARKALATSEAKGNA